MNLKTTFSKKIFWIGLAIIPLAVIASKTELDHTKSSYQPIPSSQTNTCNCYSPSTSGITIPITFNNLVPTDLFSFTFQSQADCFAWQEFISLNWPSSPNASFGTPNDTNFVQWETYMPREVLFPDDGSKPPVWGTLVSDEYSGLFKSQKFLLKKTQTKLLTFVSKIEENDATINFSPNQAAPFNKPSWMGAQNSTNVWYEIMLNKDYYDFIVQKGFYNAQVQHDTVKQNQPINFPQGAYGTTTVGAIELKAAWMEVTDRKSPKWLRYKLSNATVLDPITKKLRNTVVALVGLHILHKTQNQPTWLWATFEQVDNAPDNNNLTATPPPYGYNFYNANCTNQNVVIKTSVGDSTKVVTCNPNTSPPYYLNQAGPVPTQTTRMNNIDPTDAAPINTLMQQNIKKFYPNSVWQYYELVDVIWTQSPVPDPTTPVNIPRNINASSMLSGTHIVANSTMETYVQQTKTCFQCHIYSTIAPYPPDSTNNNKFGDFSFALSFAKYPSATANQKKKSVKK